MGRKCRGRSSQCLIALLLVLRWLTAPLLPRAPSPSVSLYDAILSHTDLAIEALHTQIFPFVKVSTQQTHRRQQYR